jgi:hypothetical protein
MGLQLRYKGGKLYIVAEPRDYSQVTIAKSLGLAS